MISSYDGIEGPSSSMALAVKAVYSTFDFSKTGDLRKQSGKIFISNSLMKKKIIVITAHMFFKNQRVKKLLDKIRLN